MDRSRGPGMQLIGEGLKHLLGGKRASMGEALYHATETEWRYRETRS